MSLKALAVIPARAHSTRFPFKVIHKIQGKPMIQYVWEAAKKSLSLDRVMIAVDHPEVEKVCLGFGAEVVMTPEFSSGTDRVAYVAQNLDYEFVINLQADEPLLPPDYIDILYKTICTSKTELATLAVYQKEIVNLKDPNRVKVVFNKEKEALYFSRQPLLSDEVGGFYLHLGLYAYRKRALLDFCKLPPSQLEKTEKLEQLRALESGMKIKIAIVTEETLAIDTPFDIQRVEKRLELDSR